jgi:hypothetical protein
VDESKILMRANIHTCLTQILDFAEFAENAQGGTTNQKAASSSLAGRT